MTQAEDARRLAEKELTTLRQDLERYTHPPAINYSGPSVAAVLD
jgi:hypothetical protein